MILFRDCLISEKKIEKGRRKCILLSQEGYDLLDDREKSMIQKYKWLIVFFVPYLQMIIYYSLNHKQPVEIQTSIGETEFDTFSKKQNLIEGILIELLIMASIWFFVYYLGMVLELRVFEYIGYVLMGFGGIYAIFLVPYLHRDSWHGLGLGKPLEIKSLLSQLKTNKKRQLIVTVIVLGVIYNYTTLPNWSLVLIRFGLRGRNPDLFRFLTQTAEGTIIAIITGIFTYLILVLVLIRWDNFLDAAKVLIPFGGLFCLGIVITGMVYATIGNDWSLFENFRWISQDSDSFLTHASFYTMWGIVQQYLFLSYFNTRFRKGFENSKRGQFLCALFTGLCFGLIHMPFLPLSTLTFIGGFLYAYFFGKDKYRNLFIVGIAHGFGGTLVSMLTPMVMNVGPW